MWETVLNSALCATSLLAVSFFAILADHRFSESTPLTT
jgi:hypothetical protein